MRSPQKRRKVTKAEQISPSEGLSEELMENSGWELRELRPHILENSGGTPVSGISNVRSWNLVSKSRNKISQNEKCVSKLSVSTPNYKPPTSMQHDD